MNISQIKQISDKEKIEIMQYYLDGGEIECRFDEKDWQVVQPSWAWNNCFYRKRIYNYPLYFEFTNVHDTESEKFIVEFTDLTEGTVVQKTYSEWEIGHFDNVWFSHTEKNFWREVDKPKELSEFDNLKSKFETGNYVCLCNLLFGIDQWVVISEYPLFQERKSFKSDIIGYKLIHKRHEYILNAYLKDNNIEIEIEIYSLFNGAIKESDFISNYNETNNYRLKPKESQIVYECYRIDKKTGESEICTKLSTDNMLKILQEDDRTQYTYHKTGRSFEIKLGDK